MSIWNTNEWRRIVARKLADAERSGIRRLTLVSGLLHREFDARNYPGPNHANATISRILLEEDQVGWKAVSKSGPESGRGATVAVTFERIENPAKVSLEPDVVDV